MASFLQALAKDIIQKYRSDFSELTIIFPNKRAGLFLAEELAKQIDRPVWMPEILTLTEYIEKQTGLKKAEPLSLIIKLYKSYIKVSKSTETFDDFYFWGNMLLGDFDDVDKYLVDAKDLFSNLVALKNLEHYFPYLTEEQLAAIQRFWQSFTPEQYSTEQQTFLNIWEKLWDTYTEFKAQLFKEQICYEGMNERHFWEHITNYDSPKQLLIAGFNALNSCEKQIFSYYQDRGCAKFYWDYDLYYTNNEHQEAGLYLRDNLKQFPNALSEEQFNNFLHNQKHIEYISVPSTIGQTKVLAQLTKQLQEDSPRDTAIVLCDEQLLIPTLHSIPENIQDINITMGYPAHSTSIAALISLLCDLKNYAKQEGTECYYYYKPVIALLNHKLIKDLFPEEIFKITKYIQEKNIIYVSEKSLRFHPFAEAIFSSSEEKTSNYLLHILQLLLQIHTSLEPIEKEFAFSIYTQIQNLQNCFEEEDIVPTYKLYLQIIRKVINNLTIPFSGEPLKGLQLMGLMETRMLDFKNLILLSANEGVLPQTTPPASFIPYNLRIGFRLPTPEHQEALFAYYFYRLLQRAKEIKIIYNSSTKGINSGEMSRFLFQLKYESGLSIQESNFQNQISTQKSQPIVIPKNPDILKVLETFQQSKEKTLSPSALNTYLECPIRFYFKYIAKITEKEEITEELAQRDLGNIFHACSQSLYGTISQGEITTQKIDQLLNNDTLIEEHIRKAYLSIYDIQISSLLDHGEHTLLLNIIKKYLKILFQYDKQFCPFRMLATEKRFYLPVDIAPDGKTQTVYVGGYIDRVDQTSKGIRVIDYKTGSDKTTFDSIASLFDPKEKERNKAAFQTQLYCLMYDHVQPSEELLIPGIYNTKSLVQDKYDYQLVCNRNKISNFRIYADEFQSALKQLLEKLYSPAVPFVQTEHINKCKYCSYAEICRKSGK